MSASHIKFNRPRRIQFAPNSRIELWRIIHNGMIIHAPDQLISEILKTATKHPLEHFYDIFKVLSIMK